MTQTLSVLVVDDESLARIRLHDMLNDLGITQVDEASNGHLALEVIQSKQPDLVFLDIEMPGMSGLTTAQQITQLTHKPMVVFCTAYDEHALEAFGVDAIDYLLKPIQSKRLERAISKAQILKQANEVETLKDRLPGHDRHINIRRQSDLHLVSIADVLYCQAKDKYVEVVHVDGSDLIEESLVSLEQTFDGLLMRIHRNCLVNPTRLISIQRDPSGSHLASLTDYPDTLKVSRRFYSAVKDYLKQR